MAYTKMTKKEQFLRKTFFGTTVCCGLLFTHLHVFDILSGYTYWVDSSVYHDLFGTGLLYEDYHSIFFGISLTILSIHTHINLEGVPFE